MTESKSALSSAKALRPISRRLDFLTLPFSPEDRLTRSDGGEFAARRPWRFARFGRHRLSRGWWTFECEGEGDLAGLELRLSSARDPLIILTPGDGARLFLQGNESFDITLLISPWPVRKPMAALGLRRLSMAETAGVVANGVRRLLVRDNPGQVIASVAKRILARQSLGVRTREPEAERAPAPATPPPGKLSGEPQILQGEQCFAIVPHGDRLHPQAFEIIEKEFAASPGVKAIYVDCREGGNLLPNPEWDETLALYRPYDSVTTFFRGQATAGATWRQINSIAAEFGPGAVRRLALPLTARDNVAEHRYETPAAPSLPRTPRVSAIIPTKYQVALLRQCLAGLADATDYPDIEVVIVDNGCADPGFEPMLEEAGRRMRIVRVNDHGDFNFPRLIDSGVRQSSGEILLLLNDDIQPIEQGWLHRMVDSALKTDVGAVGARLKYPSGDIQHAGVMLGLGGACGHLWKGVTSEQARQNPMVMLPGRRSAVTGACLAVRRELYDLVGGLDQQAFPVAFNDIDFCLRLNDRGYRTLYRGDAALIHHESQSRGPDDATVKTRERLARETVVFLERWGHLIEDDPWGSPAFDRRTESGAVVPVLLRPWPDA